MNPLRNTLLALALAGFVSNVDAEVAEVAVVNTSGTEIVPGYVFQGSRNMKKLGKRSTTSSVVVPRLFLESNIAPRPVLPQLATPELRPKPRFGYGSDWTPGKTYHAQAAPVRTGISAPYSPFYHFRPPYSTREYVPAYQFGFGFGHDCGTFFDFGRHFSFSISR